MSTKKERRQAIAKALRTLRAEHQCNQDVLADVLQINQSKYSRIETSSASLSFEDVLPLAAHFSITPADLLNRVLSHLTNQPTNKSTNEQADDNLSKLLSGQAQPDNDVLRLFSVFYHTYLATNKV